MISNFTKGEYCIVEDYQELGACIVQLERRETKNICGNPIRPIWKCYLVSSVNQEFLDFYMQEPHMMLIFEHRLLTVE